MNIQTVTHNNISFINVTTPGEQEIKELKTNYGFNPLHLEDYVHKNQVPSKIEITKNYALIVLDLPYIHLPNPQKNDEKINNSSKSSVFSLPKHVPLPQFTSSEKKKRVTNTQVNIFIGKEYVVVMHEGLLTAITDIFTNCQKSLRNRQEYMSDGTVFLGYRIIDMLIDGCFSVVNDISASIDKIDKQLEEKPSQKVIENISITRRNIVVFQTMIKPIIVFLRHLEEGKFPTLNGAMQPFWGNVLDHLQKIWDRLEDSRELIEGISESNESLLSYRNNEIVKFLTVITSFSFPFVIVNNLYSMNVAGLPFAKESWIVEILFSIIFVSGLLIIMYFKHREWI